MERNGERSGEQIVDWNGAGNEAWNGIGNGAENRSSIGTERGTKRELSGERRERWGRTQSFFNVHYCLTMLILILDLSPQQQTNNNWL